MIDPTYEEEWLLLGKIADIIICLLSRVWADYSVREALNAGIHCVLPRFVFSHIGDSDLDSLNSIDEYDTIIRIALIDEAELDL